MLKNNLKNRSVLNNIRKAILKDKIIVLLGARQTGKTSILKILYGELPSDKKLFIDLDLLSNRYLFDNELELIYFLKSKGYNENDKEIFYLIVDEFQNVKNSTTILKSIHDNYKNLRIIISGSSSLKIRKNISETMAGRTIVFKINPLTFEEFLFFKERDDLIVSLSSDIINRRSLIEVKKYFNEFLVFGSFPEVSLVDKRGDKVEILNSIFEYYIEKDIRNFYEIRNIDNFRRLIEYLAVISGNLLKYNLVASDLGINVKTIRDYISFIEDTFLIKTISPYSLKRPNSLKKAKKIYFMDTGFRNYLIKNFNENIDLRGDSGLLYETFVFNEIYKRIKINQELYFFRTKQGSEIDFILKQDEELLLLEVKKKVKRIPRILNELPEYKSFIIGEELKSKEKIKAFLLIYNFYKNLSLIY